MALASFEQPPAEGRRLRWALLLPWPHQPDLSRIQGLQVCFHMGFAARVHKPRISRCSGLCQVLVSQEVYFVYQFNNVCLFVIRFLVCVLEQEALHLSGVSILYIT